MSRSIQPRKFIFFLQETDKLKRRRRFSVNLKACTCSVWKYNTWNFYQAALNTETPFANLQIMSRWPPGWLQSPEELLQRFKLIFSYGKKWFYPLFKQVLSYIGVSYLILTLILVCFFGSPKNLILGQIWAPGPKTSIFTSQVEGQKQKILPPPHKKIWLHDYFFGKMLVFHNMY